MARPRRPKLEPRLADFRERAGLTQEQVAERLGISADMVRKHERGINQPIALYRHKYSQLYKAAQIDLGLVPRSVGAATTSVSVLADEQSPIGSIDVLLAEIGDSGTRDDAIAQLGEVTVSIAESHTQAPPRHVLKEVLQLHNKTHELIGGKQRLRQRRELFRIESDLLAHACLLFGDLKQNQIAERYGLAALAFAEEAETNEAIARTALAKTLRWADRLIESADMARLGFSGSPQTPVRTQLASQEANAAALLGDTRRAKEALRRSEDAAASIPADSGLSAWSFPVGRQAIFALSVAMQTGDPDAMLRAANVADTAWANGEPMVTANWAQIRVGAGIAHLHKGSLDEAITEVAPVLVLPPERRVSTITAYMDNLGRRLREPKMMGSKAAAELGQGILDFNAGALLDDRAVSQT